MSSLRTAVCIAAAGIFLAHAQPGNAPPRFCHPCFQGTAASGGALQVQLTANRIAGVAPLAVFFEAVAAPDSSHKRPFHDLAYCWDFGDSASGYFTTTGHSKNQARSPVAGHVYEKPGTYTVTLAVRNALNQESRQTAKITVQDPDSVFAGSSTICLSRSGDFTGCPAGAVQVQDSSIYSGLASRIATGKRFLLRRGDAFVGSSVRINVPGPGIVGAFGTGARPVINTASEVFPISDRTPNFSDWRIMDLDVRGHGNANSLIASVGGLATHLLYLRLRGDSLGGGLHAANSIIDYWNANGYPGHDIINGLTIQECELTDLVGGGGHNFSYIAARRFLFLGNRYWNSTGGEHVLRTPWIERGFLYANDMGGAPAPRHVLKMHAPGFASQGVGQGKYTERVSIHDNIFRGDSGHQWTVGLGPQNDQSDERLRDILVERNQFTPGPAVQVALLLWAQDVSARNNLFDRGTFRTCIEVGPRGIEPPPLRVSLLHNTCWNTGTQGPVLATVSATAAQVSAFNNFVAGSQTGQVLSGGGAAAAAIGNNVVTTSPVFAAPQPSAWADFRLAAASPAQNAGAAAYGMFWDFEGRTRGPSPDCGSFEYEAGQTISGRPSGATGNFRRIMTSRNEIVFIGGSIPLRAALCDLQGRLVSELSAPGPVWNPKVRRGTYLLRLRYANGYETIQPLAMY